MSIGHWFHHAGQAIKHAAKKAGKVILKNTKPDGY